MHCALSISFRLLVCTSLLSSTWPAVAQQQPQQPGAGAQLLQQLIDQQARISSLEGQMNEIRADNSVLADLVKSMLAQQAAASKLAEFAKADPKALKQEAEKALPRADIALTNLAAIPDEELGKNLKERIQTCITNIKSTAETQLKSQAPDPKAAIEACKEVDQRLIQSELEKLKQDALKEWESCRSTLEQAGMINGTNLPRDPSGLSTQSSQDMMIKIEQLQKLYKQTEGPARDCISTLNNAFKKLRAQENASAAMSMALGLAVQVCAASGGNPYVCGGALVVAILMNLFKGGGGGGGNGDEKGPENAHRGNGKVITTGSLPEPTPAPADPACPGGGCGKFGNTQDGKVGCDPSGEVLVCWLRAKPQVRLKVDPAKSVQKTPPVARQQLGQAISQGQASRIIFCPQSSPNFVKGLLLAAAAPDEYYSILASYDDSGLALTYPPQSFKAKSKNPDELCAGQFR